MRSEYHPHNSGLMMSITPVGTDKISDSLDLEVLSVKSANENVY